MRIRVYAALLAAGALAACVEGNVLTESPGALEASPAWATPVEDDTGGTGAKIVGSLTPDGDAKTIANVKLTGAQAGATYAWHVHYGTCATDVGVVGETSLYPALTIGPNGEGTATATLPFTTPSKKTGTFFIKVHEASSMSNIVACTPLNPKGVRAANYE
ncbi:MAG TPA: hypothetical protein VJ672_15150 [Gemmatimonadaceae bacterium]|nr:hypothetical protein [Gemmatimonadaceae bacterium]